MINLPFSWGTWLHLWVQNPPSSPLICPALPSTGPDPAEGTKSKIAGYPDMPSISINPFQKRKGDFRYFSFCTSIRSTNFQSLLSSFRAISSYDRLHSLFLSVWLQGTTNESPSWMSTCLKVSDPCQGIGQHWKPCIAMRVPYFQRLP